MTTIKKTFLRLSILLLTILNFSACYYSHPNQTDHWKPEDLSKVDSVEFQINHHYWKGFNFQITDSLTVKQSLSAITDGYYTSNDSLLADRQKTVFRKNDKIAVADIAYLPTDTVDTVWVKVVGDHLTLGWTHEKEMLKNVVVNDSISKFIYFFSSTKTIIFLTIFGFAILMVVVYVLIRKMRKGDAVKNNDGFLFDFNRLVNPYPLLCVCCAVAATIYGSIQHFVPATWVEFYYHPTINPFSAELPLIMKAFLLSVWVLPVVFLAKCIDLVRSEGLLRALYSIAGIAALSVLIYLIFTIAPPVLAYPLLFIYFVFTLRHYLRLSSKGFTCGACGRKIQGTGKCPHCGAINTD